MYISALDPSSKWTIAVEWEGGLAVRAPFEIPIEFGDSLYLRYRGSQKDKESEKWSTFEPISF